MVRQFKTLFMLCLICILGTGCGSEGAQYVTEMTNYSQNADADYASYDGNMLTEENVTESGNVKASDASITSDKNREVAVYVCGAVVSPGVYYLNDGDIKKVALEAAGGYAEGASTDYINLAEIVTAGEKIYFPYEAEVEADLVPYQSKAKSSAETSGKININKADVEQLKNLPGIGENKARLIVEYREANGPFTCVEDIMNINGIKDGVYGKIKDYITVE